MSESFSTVLVKDNRLNCKSYVRYAVEKGGSNVTFNDVKANSASNTSMTFNVIVPSEVTVIDRRVEWRAICNFRLRFTNLPAGNDAANGYPPYDLVQYGLAGALCAYPLHACCTTVSTTINNNTTTANMDDILQVLIRFMDRKHIHKYTSTAPTMPDNYYNFNDAVNAVNNPLAGYNNGEKESDYHGRGAFPLINISLTAYNGPTGSIYSGAGGDQDLYISFRSVEPFMLSPFAFGHESVNSQGFYGIQNMNFRMNFNSTYPLWDSAELNNGSSTHLTNIPEPTVQIDSFDDATLTFCYITPHPEDMLPAKNVVSFLEMPRYITQGSATIAPLTTGVQSINNIQLNQVPDKLVFAVRRKNLSVFKSNSFLPITNISINWNNCSGILSAANQEKLWLMSVESGINQSWPEWSGKTHAWKNTMDGVTPVAPYPALQTPLVGGILALDFAKDIEIRESFYAPGSLGTFQLQARLTFYNQDPDEQVTPNDYEILVITVNSGVYALERGTASTYTGILTKQDVLDASSQKAVFRHDVERLVGAGLMDNLKTSVGSAMAKEGSGASGGEDTGAGMSGGRRHRR